MLNLKALLTVFEIFGGIDTTIELCKKVVKGIHWVVQTTQKIVHKIRNAKK